MRYTLKRDDMSLLSQWINKKGTFGSKSSFLFGGEREIRTLGTVLAFTRFPVVRLRPAQPSLQIDFIIISHLFLKIKSFFKFFLKIIDFPKILCYNGYATQNRITLRANGLLFCRG